MKKIRITLNRHQVEILAETLPNVQGSRLGHCERLALMEWHCRNAGALQYAESGIRASFLPSQAYALATWLSASFTTDPYLQVEATAIIDSLARHLPANAFRSP